MWNIKEASLNMLRILMWTRRRETKRGGEGMLDGNIFDTEKCKYLGIQRHLAFAEKCHNICMYQHIISSPFQSIEGYIFKNYFTVHLHSKVTSSLKL